MNPITIGVLSPVTGGFYYGKIVAGIAREVASVGGRVVLVQTLDAGLGSDEVVSAPSYSSATAWDHLDGVVSIASATHQDYLHRLIAAGKPIALASDEIEGFDVPSATPDNSAGVTEAVDHLIGHGHTRARGVSRALGWRPGRPDVCDLPACTTPMTCCRMCWSRRVPSGGTIRWRRVRLAASQPRAVGDTTNRGSNAGEPRSTDRPRRAEGCGDVERGRCHQ